MVYLGNAFDSRRRLRGDSVPLGSGPTKSQKKKRLFGLAVCHCSFSISSSLILFFVLFPFVLKTKVKREYIKSMIMVRVHPANKLFRKDAWLTVSVAKTNPFKICLVHMQVCTSCRNSSLAWFILSTLAVGLTLFCVLLYWNWSRNVTTSITSFFFFCQVCLQDHFDKWAFWM